MKLLGSEKKKKKERDLFTSGGGREGLTRLFVVINIYIYILTESEWRKVSGLYVYECVCVFWGVVFGEGKGRERERERERGEEEAARG